jgi:hypothetical protein
MHVLAEGLTGMLSNTELRNTIPASILAGAGSLLQEQGTVPESPGVHYEGRVNLCTAAAVAFSAAQTYAHADAQSMIREAVVRGEKRLLADVFETFGWPEKLCVQLMTENDAIPSDERLQAMVRLIG